MNSKHEIIDSLRERIGAIEIEMVKNSDVTAYPLGIAEIDLALKHGGILAGACHEIMGAHDGAVIGFILVMLSAMVKKGPIIWCSPLKDFYTPGFLRFGIKDSDVIFVNTDDRKQALWATETALACTKIAGVLLHASAMSLAEGRRLKLMAHKHQTTALFWLKHERVKLPTIATTRWHIRQAPSSARPSRNGINAVGAPRLSVDIVRNLYGHAPLSWILEFDEQALCFRTVSPLLSSASEEEAQRDAICRRERVA